MYMLLTQPIAKLKTVLYCILLYSSIYIVEYTTIQYNTVTLYSRLLDMHLRGVIVHHPVSAFLDLRSLLRAYLMFSNRVISITAPRLWNDLPPELCTISLHLPPPPSLTITRHHNYSSGSSIRHLPGLPLKIKMLSLQTLLPRPI